MDHSYGLVPPHAKLNMVGIIKYQNNVNLNMVIEIQINIKYQNNVNLNMVIEIQINTLVYLMELITKNIHTHLFSSRT